MTAFFAATLTALWLGILTSISPCPLATNIAAVSFVSRRMGHPAKVFMTGVFYTFGRMLTYMGIAALIVASLLSMPALSRFLQKTVNMALGPLLILTGLVLLDVLPLPLPSSGMGGRMQRRVESMGILGSILLGIVFALSFCPVSAALFFGSLIPVALAQKSGIVLPAVYGIGTGLPVLIFSLLIALGATRVAAAYDKIAVFERWARRVTGGLFIVVGVYFCLIYILRIQL